MMRLGLTDLLEGRTFGTKTFLDWTDDGSIMDFHGYKGDQLTEFMTTQINNIIINLHWTQMRVFIIGGWPCNQDPELGKGPDEGGMCDEDGLAWYILYLKADPVGNHVFADKNAFSSKIKGLQDVPGLSASNRRWGFVQPPPGMQYMGVPPYEGVTYKVRISPTWLGRGVCDSRLGPVWPRAVLRPRAGWRWWMLTERRT